MTRQYKQPRLAEMIANDLRVQILDGALGDGEMLPRQEELLESFGVSPPSLRGALQILETEGLITVLRGSVGGAVVHTPNARGVAYHLSLVLQANGIGLRDVAIGLEQVEPLCAQLCAQRSDRNTTVVPELWKIQQATADNLEDFDLVTRAARRFHEQLVSGCGNETLILLVGALETVWSAHERAWADELVERGNTPPAIEERRRYMKTHEEIIVAIADGDATLASERTRAHLLAAQRSQIAPADAKVDAEVVRSIQVRSGTQNGADDD